MMSCKAMIEQRVTELRAEYQAATSNRKRKRIFEELWLCELMLVGLEWRAEREAREA
jgi:hypothetical protein